MWTGWRDGLSHHRTHSRPPKVKRSVLGSDVHMRFVLEGGDGRDARTNFSRLSESRPDGLHFDGSHWAEPLALDLRMAKNAEEGRLGMWRTRQGLVRLVVIDDGSTCQQCRKMQMLLPSTTTVCTKDFSRLEA